MKKIGFSLLVLLIGISVAAQKYLPTENGTEINFRIKNFGFTVNGSFSGISGLIQFNPSNLGNSRFEMSVVSSTVFTKNRSRDNHLREKDYFFTEKFPAIYLASTSITKSNQNGYYVFEGELYIKGISKKVSFEFSAKPAISGYVFKGEFEMNRSDFRIGSNSISLSDQVIVSLNVMTIKN
jgi:polyisoprenoid-binding protein YceI